MSGKRLLTSYRYLANLFVCFCFVYQASCQTSLSSQDQQELLNAHNHYRSIVAPTASNMEGMVSTSSDSYRPGGDVLLYNLFGYYTYSEPWHKHCLGGLCDLEDRRTLYRIPSETRVLGEP